MPDTLPVRVSGMQALLNFHMEYNHIYTMLEYTPTWLIGVPTQAKEYKLDFQTYNSIVVKFEVGI